MGWLTSLYCFMHVGRSVDKPTFADGRMDGHSRIIPGHPASHHQSIHQVVVNKLLGLSHIESHCAAGRGSSASPPLVTNLLLDQPSHLSGTTTRRWMMILWSCPAYNSRSFGMGYVCRWWGNKQINMHICFIVYWRWMGRRRRLSKGDKGGVVVMPTKR